MWYNILKDWQDTRFLRSRGGWVFIKLLVWLMRFVLLGMVYLFLYKVIKVMYNDVKTGRNEKGMSAGIEVVETADGCSIPVGAVYPLHGVTNIGRMPDNNVVLDYKYVSNYHARIYLKNNEYVIKDMDSTNGTFLNETKVDRPMVIKDDDLINIGGIVFKVIG